MRFALIAIAITLAAQTPPVRIGAFAAESRTFYTAAGGLPSDDLRSVQLDPAGAPTVITASGAATFVNGVWKPAAVPPPAPRLNAEARPDGLYVKTESGLWERQFPRSGARSWAPVDVRGVAYDTRGRLWFASPQGAGVLDGSTWTLYTGADGLPYDDFTCVAAGEDGVVWFGTHLGAIRFDGHSWEYRAGPRWLPNDDVRAIAVDSHGTAWIATAGGLAQIKRTPMTLAAKALIFEAEIDKRHRRTPYQYVHPVVLQRPGDTASFTQVDSDNDGLWTAMYGAGECFACGAGIETACSRARQAFKALEFLRLVTQGGPHPAPRGFVARSILPTSGPDPNLHDSPARDRAKQLTDHRWKLITPRWPRDASGQWYWKSDTSSDELDGHYFFYGLYYDLAAKTEEDRQAVRTQVRELTDHLIGHGFTLVDHDGHPTRWGYFNPAELNLNRDWWEERGLNSLSMLAYLKVAHHITGDERYARAAHSLIQSHGYAANAMIAKSHLGPGGGNQSDDEMIFMNYFSLLRYETGPDLRQKYLLGFYRHWQNEAPEMNPLFNFLYAAVARNASFESAFGREDLSISGAWLEDSLATLRSIPLDRVGWPFRNSHRKDLSPLAHFLGAGRAVRVNGKVIPADERYFSHWNHDPYQLDRSSDGLELGDGAVFLLPYYAGLYYGFFKE